MRKALFFSIALFVFAVKSFAAMNCDAFGGFVAYNGHYYTATANTMTYANAKSFAELNGGYLAIPNDGAENDFISTVLKSPKSGWIGIHDPNRLTNFCKETTPTAKMENCAGNFSNSFVLSLYREHLCRCPSQAEYDGWITYIKNNNLTDESIILNAFKNSAASNGESYRDYCNYNLTCAYSDSRFKTIKGGALVYKNWMDKQPDNLVRYYDYDERGVARVDLGEAWVALSTVNKKWADYGNHFDEYNNPVKMYAIFEFDTKPECMPPDNNVTDKLEKLSCNDSVLWDSVTSSTNSKTFECQTDANGVKYCPANLAACNNVQNTNNGYSQSHTGIATTTNSLQCSNGGTLSGTTCSKTCQTAPTYSCPNGGYVSGTTCIKTCQGTPTYSCPSNMTLNTTYNYCYVQGLTMYKSGYTVGIYQLALSRTPDVDGYNYWSSRLSTPPTKSNVYEFVNGAKTNGEKVCGRTISAGLQTDISVMYIWYLGRCPDPDGWNYWNTGSNWKESEFLNGAKIECPSCPKPPYLNNSCPTGTSYNSTYSTCTTSPTSTSSSYQCNYAATGTTTNYDCSYTATCPSGTNLPSQCNGSYSNSWLKDMYTSLLKRCPDQTGYNHWLNYISANGYTSSAQLQPIFCTAAARNNEPCGSANPSSTTCYGSQTYTYYTYHCDTSTNVYNESYAVKNAGGESYTSSTPPTNNCVQQDYKCGANPDQTCIKDGGVWKCSQHPCVDANNIENTDTEVGANDAKNDGWSKEGSCNGQLYIFSGEDNRCRSDDIFFGLTGGGCCDKDKVFLGLIPCKADEQKLSIKNKKEQCHEVGEYCSKKIKLGFTKFCVQHKKTSCCFNSKLAKIINEQGRPQINKNWGTAQTPNCKGFTPEEFQTIDFSKLDLSSLVKDISTKINETSITNMNNYVKDKVNSFYSH